MHTNTPSTAACQPLLLLSYLYSCCSILSPAQLSGSWLYAGGHGTICTPAQVLMVLVAGLMPEELQDDTAAGQLREVQLALLSTLAQAHPEALLYSNFFR